MRLWLALSLSMVLAACASTPARAPLEHPNEFSFNDQLFAPPVERISADDVFALSPDMKRYLDTEIAAASLAKGPRQGLFQALYSRGQLKLDYDAEITRNAAEAFSAKSGNCLSLVILTAAFAKSIGQPVRYQTVYLDEAWSRSNDIDFLDEHVNVTLGAKRRIGQTGHLDENELTIDFLPPHDLGSRRARVIGEPTVVAMYMNNRGAEWLARRQLDRAYWWTRAAIAQDPHYMPAYNTLGVIYKFHGNPEQARQVFEHILAIEPENTVSMSNQVLVLNELGRTADANALAERLKKIKPYPPFHFYDLGMQAMQQGNYAAARSLFSREIERSAYYHESHFWLAIADYRLGDLRQARKQMAVAMALSTTNADHALYAAKLERLKSGRGF